MNPPLYIRRVLGLILFVQVLYALVIGPLISKTDVFPLHQWALFGKVFRTDTLPVIYVSKLDSQVFNPAKNYYDLIAQRGPIDFLVGRDNLTTWTELLREQKNKEADEMRQSVINHLWPHVSDLEYEIRIVKVNLLDFATKRQVIETQNVYGPFRKEGKN